MTDIKSIDPKGLIRESYNIENISMAQCRTIFFEWAVQIPADINATDYIEAGLAYYAPRNPPNHPMTQVMRDGLKPAETARRRGGRAARISKEV